MALEEGRLKSDVATEPVGSKYVNVPKDVVHIIIG